MPYEELTLQDVKGKFVRALPRPALPGASYDPAYVNKRNALIPAAEEFANGELIRRGISLRSVGSKHVWNRAFSDAMDELWEKSK